MSVNEILFNFRIRQSLWGLTLNIYCVFYRNAYLQIIYLKVQAYKFIHLPIDMYEFLWPWVHSFTSLNCLQVQGSTSLWVYEFYSLQILQSTNSESTNKQDYQTIINNLPTRGNPYSLDPVVEFIIENLSVPFIE